MPTVDTVRYQFLCMALISTMSPVLIVGAVGTGKTSVLESTLSKFDPGEYSLLTVNMSAQVCKFYPHIWYVWATLPDSELDDLV